MIRAITIVAATCLATACVDPEADDSVAPAPGTTAMAAASLGCTGTVTTSGTLPAYSSFWGWLPSDVSSTQAWVSHPLDADSSQYAMYLVDWERGRVTWRARLNPVQRALALALASGRVGRVNGVRTPPPPPPPTGTDWLKFVVAYGKGAYVAFDAAVAGSPCLGSFEVTSPVPDFEPWLGILPADISPDQVWFYHALDSGASEFAAYQIDPVASRVAWATRVPASQLPILIGQMDGSRIGRVGGVRNPPPPPPPDGEEWRRRLLVGAARGVYISYEIGQIVGGIRRGGDFRTSGR